MRARADLESGIQAVKDDTVKLYCCGCMCGSVCLGALIGLIFLLCSITSLGPEEQVVIFGPKGKYERNGPATILVTPARKKEWRKATRLSPREYAVIKNTKSGEYRHEEGPQLLFIGAYDVQEEVRPKMVLQKHEYVRLIDSLSGFERIASGPQTIVPKPLETWPDDIENAVVLGTDLAVLSFNKTTGKKRLVTEGGVFIPTPYEVILEVRKATLLGQRDFAVVKNVMDGTLRHVEGPQLLQVGAYDTVLKVKAKVVLEKDEYIRLMDEATGVERIERGPKTFVPQPTEVYTEGVQKAAFLDTDTAILVLNEVTGQERLVTTKGVFVPSPDEEILETRELIRVLPHEAVVLRDAGGAITVQMGSYDAQASAFFLPPYSEVVVHNWSSYSEPTDGEQKLTKVTFQKIDMRTRKMFFSYEVRTSDNVKLKLEGTIFWRVNDVPKMINVTSDPEGDVWHHARSALIQAVSQNTLQIFMKSFNNITMEAFNAQAADGFYTGRGVVLSSMELTKFETTDEETKEVLQKIIQESTNRVNRLQQQQGENEVKAAELSAEILLERQKTEFIKAQADNKRLEAKMEGEAVGMTLMKAADAFIGGLNETVENVTSRVDLYKLHETLKGHNVDINNLASGKAELFLTPSNVNLKLAMGGAATGAAPLGSVPAASDDRRLQETGSRVVADAIQEITKVAADTMQEL